MTYLPFPSKNFFFLSDFLEAVLFHLEGSISYDKCDVHLKISLGSGIIIWQIQSTVTLSSEKVAMCFHELLIYWPFDQTDFQLNVYVWVF